MIESNNPLFEVDVENYNGPLDVLLDLAKAQKVNLEEISITKLADQFHNYISNKKDLNLEELVKANNIKVINEWLKEKIHQFGQSKTPAELLLDVTGESFNPMYYVEYLKEKYSALYL